jgi:hypothetical protein
MNIETEIIERLRKYLIYNEECFEHIAHHHSVKQSRTLSNLNRTLRIYLTNIISARYYRKQQYLYETRLTPVYGPYPRSAVA